MVQPVETDSLTIREFRNPESRTGFMTSLVEGVLFESLAVTGISYCSGNPVCRPPVHRSYLACILSRSRAYHRAHALRIAVLALSFSFVASALLNFRHSNWFVSAFYTLASVWLGFANYFFLAACLTWPLWYSRARLAKPAIRWSGPYWPAFSSQWARWPASVG